MACCASRRGATTPSRCPTRPRSWCVSLLARATRAPCAPFFSQLIFLFRAPRPSLSLAPGQQNIAKVLWLLVDFFSTAPAEMPGEGLKAALGLLDIGGRASRVLRVSLAAAVAKLKEALAVVDAAAVGAIKDAASAAHTVVLEAKLRVSAERDSAFESLGQLLQDVAAERASDKSALDRAIARAARARAAAGGGAGAGAGAGLTGVERLGKFERSVYDRAHGSVRPLLETFIEQRLVVCLRFALAQVVKSSTAYLDDLELNANDSIWNSAKMTAAMEARFGARGGAGGRKQDSDYDITINAFIEMLNHPPPAAVPFMFAADEVSSAWPTADLCGAVLAGSGKACGLVIKSETKKCALECEYM